MRLKIPGIVFVLLLVLITVGLAQFRTELAHLPRVRVGPLVSERPAGDRLRFLVIGDSGTAGENQIAVARAMEDYCVRTGNLDGMLLLGDNAYQAGFDDVDDPTWQTKVFGPYGSPCLGQLPMFPVLGNHDYKGNAAAQIEMSRRQPRWHMPNRFYSVRFGSLLNLIAFDSQLSEFCFRPSQCAVDFLLRESQVREMTWTIVLSHHPLDSSSARGFGHTGSLRGVLLKPLVCGKVDAWFAGHAHHLEHMQPDGCRMELFISGGGGASLYEVVAGRPGSKFAVSRHGFLVLDVTPSSMTAAFYGVDGQEMYRTSRQK